MTQLVAKRSLENTTPAESRPRRKAVYRLRHRKRTEDEARREKRKGQGKRQGHRGPRPDKTEEECSTILRDPSKLQLFEHERRHHNKYATCTVAKAFLQQFVLIHGSNTGYGTLVTPHADLLFYRVLEAAEKKAGTERRSTGVVQCIVESYLHSQGYIIFKASFPRRSSTSKFATGTIGARSSREEQGEELDACATRTGNRLTRRETDVVAFS
ncbi:unnamed protein product [Pleuronectes platessa]|uniref:Uncharacterized protein n=1 Tax=Pleuronectes platessa TaxID=8262 RepID=A0A9N7V289_PLEPL|nr:unnamed protein product [Pleuronectes platessa]